MRQWHQGKEGFMKVTRIQDKYNPDKVWMGHVREMNLTFAVENPYAAS